MKELLEILMATRQQGTTTALVKLAIESSGVLICHTSSYAADLARRNNGLRTIGLHEAARRLHGRAGNGPILIDNSTLLDVCREYDADMQQHIHHAYESYQCDLDKLVAENMHNSEVIRIRHERTINTIITRKILRLERIQAMKVNRKIRNGAGFKSFFSSLQPPPPFYVP